MRCSHLGAGLFIAGLSADGLVYVGALLRCLAVLVVPQHFSMEFCHEDEDDVKSNGTVKNPKSNFKSGVFGCISVLSCSAFGTSRFLMDFFTNIR